MLKYNASHEIPLPPDLNRILKSYLKGTLLDVRQCLATRSP